MKFLREHPRVQVELEDTDHLISEFKIEDFNVRIANLYGDDIPRKLFGKEYLVRNLLVLKYDDMWLSQLIAINERALLFDLGKNYLTIFKELIAEDRILDGKYQELIENEGNEKILGEIVDHLLKRHKDDFDGLDSQKLPRPYRQIGTYLADDILVLAASEAET